MSERRRAERTKSYMGGRLIYNHRHSTMDCVLRNMAEHGAKLAFTNSASVPDRFELHVHRAQRTYTARVAWRGPDEIGVEFLGVAERPNIVAFEPAARLRKLESENLRLRQRVAQLSSGG